MASRDRVTRCVCDKALSGLAIFLAQHNAQLLLETGNIIYCSESSAQNISQNHPCSIFSDCVYGKRDCQGGILEECNVGQSGCSTTGRTHLQNIAS